jgi:hypothetical protein
MFTDFGRCRGCNATIAWAQTKPKDGKSSKPIPLDPDPAIDGNIEIRNGLAVVVGADSPPEDLRYKSHFATCPDAKKFSRDSLRRALKRTEDRRQV